MTLKEQIRALIQHWDSCPTDDDIEAACVCGREGLIAHLITLIRKRERTAFGRGVQRMANMTRRDIDSLFMSYESEQPK